MNWTRKLIRMRNRFGSSSSFQAPTNRCLQSLFTLMTEDTPPKRHSCRTSLLAARTCQHPNQISFLSCPGLHAAHPTRTCTSSAWIWPRRKSLLISSRPPTCSPCVHQVTGYRSCTVAGQNHACCDFGKAAFSNTKCMCHFNC